MLPRHSSRDELILTNISGTQIEDLQPTHRKVDSVELDM